MKRTFPALLALLILLVAACGGGAAEPAAEPPAGVVADVATLPAPTLPPPVIERVEGEEEETAAGEAAAESLPEAAAAEPAAVKTPWPATAFGYGIQVHGNATVGDPAATMDVVGNQLGLDWVKVQVQWFVVERQDAEQWFFYDAVVEQAREKGLHLLLSVVGAPEWTRAAGTHNGPPDDYTHFARFLEKLLTRYDGAVDAIEVWNEQNLDREWATAQGIDPAAYVELLKVGFETIKAHDPDIIVISGALSPTALGDWVRYADDFEYLDRALAAGMLQYADCVGAHHNGYNIGPDVTAEAAPTTAEAATATFRGPFDDPRHLWSFKTTLDTYAAKVQAVDPNMKLCVTEFGWASSEGYDAVPQNFGFALDNTLQEQATYIVQAFQEMRQSGNVWLAFLFNFDFGNKGGGPTDDPVPYSIIDINGAPRPAFDALAAMEKIR